MKNAHSDAKTGFPSDLKGAIEDALDRFLPAEDRQPEPLHRAMRYAVFASGKRLRPLFLLKVAQSAGLSMAQFDLALRTACAIELIHIASLVKDDLPCFDDAAVRNGRPTVHSVFGEARALLAADALLAQGFALVAATPRPGSSRALSLLKLLVIATGSLSGLGGHPEFAHIAAPHRTVRAPESAASYHEAKTTTLFGMAAEAAAVLAGVRQTAAWAEVGRLVASGYQMAHALTSAAMPHSAQTEIVLQSQLHALFETLRARITTLAHHPAPLIEFLDGLCRPLLILRSHCDSQNSPRSDHHKTLSLEGEPT